MILARGQIIKTIENNTTYQRCVFFPEGEFLLKNTIFENCSFREYLKLKGITGCKFIELLEPIELGEKVSIEKDLKIRKEAIVRFMQNPFK